jgi:hypothetical protein
MDGKFQIPLAFLAPGKKFTAKIFSDASPTSAGSNPVKIEERTVDATSVLDADIPANGGEAILMTPLSL